MGNFIATILGRIINLRSSSATTNVDGNKENEEEINEAEMPQLPDTVLRSVFKKLQFRDIKSCRLVCKQWHRFTLENVIFMLAVDHVCPTEPGGNSIPASELSNLPALDQDRFRFKLVPFSAATDPAKIRAACEDRAKLVLKPSTQLQMHQLAAIINDNFKAKIYYVQLFITKRREMPPVFRALADFLPSAELICVTQEDSDDGRLPGIWAVFERERGSQSGRSAPKLRKLLVSPQYVERAGLATIQLLANQAANVRKVDTTWPVIEKLLEHYEANNNGESPLFEECQTLFCGRVRNRGATPFLRISNHFRNLEQLAWSMGRLETDLDFENLERLAYLKTLELNHLHQAFRAGSLFLPSSLSSLTLQCLLPDDPKYFVSSSLEELYFNAVAENVRKLAAHARDGGNNLANLKTMRLARADLEAVRTFLRIILRTASKVEHLVLYPLPPRLPATEITTLFAIWMDIANVSPRLTEFACGPFLVPDAIDANGLIERIMQSIERAKFRAPFVFIEFEDNAAGDLSTALVARGRSIKTVERGWRIDAAFTRTGDATGQKLKIRVFSFGAA